MDTEKIIQETVRKAEQEHGHAFSGGEGLSAFLKIYYKKGNKQCMVREYGNGVVVEKLGKMLADALPEFEYMDYNLD